MSTRIVSPDVEVHWAGWTSSLFKLQHYGWDISVYEDHMDRMYRVYLRHKQSRRNCECYGVGSISNDIRYYLGRDRDFGHSIKEIEIKMAENLIISDNIPKIDYTYPIDATPRMVEMSAKNCSLRDMRIFASLEPAEQEIVLAEPTMEEILKMALSRQESKQKEIRDRIYKDSRIKANLRLAA